MEYHLDTGGQRRLNTYFDRIGDALGSEGRRSSFALYAFGLFGEGERKSMEPIAARACADPKRVDAVHQQVQHFVSNAKWSDHRVRRVASSYVTSAMTVREAITAWIVDDTGFEKQGEHSVGVQRQYTGTAGKITNCQIGVSLSVATATEHAPIDFELYLPKDWTDDPVRRKKARIPEEVTFMTKPELALRMIERAVDEGVPIGPVLADSAFGDNAEFRRQLRCFGLDYAVGIHGPTTVWRLDPLNRRIGDPVAVSDLAVALGPSSYRRTIWRQGSKRKLSSRFAMERVVLAHDDGIDPSEREDVALLIEWPEGEPAPTKFSVATVPRSMSRQALIRLVKERWRTERVYEDLKGELGLDHFEGRSFTGWHHHVSVALCCFAFIVADRIRAIPPSGRYEDRYRPHRVPPRAPLSQLVHHRALGHREGPGHLATAMSSMPPLSDTEFCTCGSQAVEEGRR